MKKLRTIIKREYLTRVNSKAFIFSTILGPIVMVAFTVVPVLIAMMETGEATRLAIVDQTGRIYNRVRESIVNESSEGSEPSSSALPMNMSQSPKERARRAGIAMKGDFKSRKLSQPGALSKTSSTS